MPPLANSRWEKFVQAIHQGESATQAYETAGYRRHRGNATRLRANERVTARLEELRAEAAERNAITVDRVLEEWRRIAFFDTGRLYDEEADQRSLLPVPDLPEDVRAVVGEVTVTEGPDGTTTKLKLLPKIPALQFLSKYLGIDQDTETVEPLADRLARLRAQRERAIAVTDEDR